MAKPPKRKERGSINGTFAWRLIEMLESPAYQSLACRLTAQWLGLRSSSLTTAASLKRTAGSPAPTSISPSMASIMTRSPRRSVNWLRWAFSRSPSGGALGTLAFGSRHSIGSRIAIGARIARQLTSGDASRLSTRRKRSPIRPGCHSRRAVQKIETHSRKPWAAPPLKTGPFAACFHPRKPWVPSHPRKP